ncbi:MAG: DUF411 domain-containing protein [Gemmatimonadota bacterium]|nr:DUF411 domain-containing protein [Gemmatimonadota bacterium]
MRLVNTVSIAAALMTLAAAAAPSFGTPAAPPSITVYHSPTCGCCKEWVKHLEANGFTVKSIEQADVSPIKAELGVPRKLVSCHTAVVAGYVVEGHVPAADIHRLLREKPKVAGLTAPGMPGASPGMNTSKDPYDVLTFDVAGQTTVWAKH